MYKTPHRLRYNSLTGALRLPHHHRITSPITTSTPGHIRGLHAVLLPVEPRPPLDAGWASTRARGSLSPPQRRARQLDIKPRNLTQRGVRPHDVELQSTAPLLPRRRLSPPPSAPTSLSPWTPSSCASVRSRPRAPPLEPILRHRRVRAVVPPRMFRDLEGGSIRGLTLFHQLTTFHLEAPTPRAQLSPSFIDDLRDERTQFVSTKDDVVLLAPHATTQHKLHAYPAHLPSVSALGPMLPLHTLDRELRMSIPRSLDAALANSTWNSGRRHRAGSLLAALGPHLGGRVRLSSPELGHRCALTLDAELPCSVLSSSP
ncbi:hypothetical protein K438DRAFT_2140351 [Mycena galopus ATCC 62051]|nr:hypothetical protein K438DRAFT_2140351 [Mycena galopus ATCC 62051]